MRLRAAAQQGFGALLIERQLVKQLLGRDQRHQALDPLVTDGVVLTDRVTVIIVV